MQAVHRLHHAAAGLRRTSWLQLAGYAWLGFFLILLLKLAAPAALGPALRKLGLALPLVLLAAKDLAHLPDALRRLRSAGTLRERIAALLPPELVGMARLDRLMWIGFFHWLRRRAPHRLPEGARLGYLQRGAYGTAVGIAMVALFVELPIDVLIVNLLIEDGGKRMAFHAIGAVAAVYSLAWVLGDRWHVGEGSHLLTAGTLHLRVGVRTQGAVPLCAIERVETIAEAPERWRRRHAIHRADTISVTPFDRPNCVLVLRPDAEVKLLHWQVERRAPRYLLLYVDRPELLARHAHAA